MKRQGNLKERIIDLDNVASAAHKAFRGKRGKKEVKEFTANFNENISKLRDEIENGDVTIGKYHYFNIYDPKERVICAASLDERILHHSIMNVCHSRFDKAMISDTYATRPGKGVYAALDRAKVAMGKYEYYAKLDVRKYYDSVDHDVLKSIICRLFKEQWLLSLLFRIIDSYSVAPNKGIPIGNLTSQYFANLYLSGLDHYMKEECKTPVYIRYMDDVLFFSDDRKTLQAMIKAFLLYSSDELKLNVKQPQSGRCCAGCSFLGYKVMPGYLLLNGNSKKRFRRKLCEYAEMYNRGELNDGEYKMKLTPLLAFTLHASSKSFRRDCISCNEQR